MFTKDEKFSSIPFTILFSSSWFFSFSHFLLKSSRRDTNFGLDSKERNITMEYRYLIFRCLCFSLHRQTESRKLQFCHSLAARVQTKKGKANQPLADVIYRSLNCQIKSELEKLFSIRSLLTIMSSRSSFLMDIPWLVLSPVVSTESLVTLLYVYHRILRA